MKSRLTDVITAIRLSRDVIRNIKENLFWAFFYNIIGIPLAAGVWYPMFGIRLNPMFGAAAMSLSSLFVVGNALRLRNFKPYFFKEEECKNNKEKEREEMKKTMIIEGMMCAHCTGRVQKALEDIEGVESVSMSLENKSAELTLGGEVADDVLREAVTQAGYEVTEIK